MTESWCIVAIPEEEDSVWRASSEKVPHCTLLFLGEQDSPEKAIHIVEQLQHMVSTTLTKFCLDVHSRGTLGDKSADVLFFDQARIPKDLLEFRSQLLKDDTIRECYDSTEQYPSWTPHLTMGYPGTPAKKDPNRFSDKFRTVFFDRIALWISDYDGPTIDLEYQKTFGGPRRRTSDWDSVADPSLAMSDATRSFLMHGTQLAESRHYATSAIGARVVDYTHPIHEALAPAIKMAVESTSAISNEQHYLKHADLGDLKSSNTIQRQYVDDIQHSFAEHLDKLVRGKPSERANRKYDIATHNPTGEWLVSSIDTVSKEGTVEARIRPVINDQGVIVDYAVSHTAITEDDVPYALMHWGVKGMRWGVRRSSSDSSGGGGSSAKRKEKAEAKAVAARLKRSDDANTTLDIKKKLKSDKMHSLSNQELQTAITRMQLESQLSAAMVKNPKAKSEGRKYVESLFVDTAKTAIKQAVQEAATKEAKRLLNDQIEAAKQRRAEAQQS